MPAAKGKAKSLRYRRGRSGDAIKEEDDLEDALGGHGTDGKPVRWFNVGLHSRTPRNLFCWKMFFFFTPP